MKNSIFSLCFLFAFGNSILAQTELEKQNDSGFITIEVIYFFDEIDYAFYQTYNAYLNGENAKAGARLRRAAYFVEQEASEAKVHNIKPIKDQAQRLKSLADSIASNRTKSAYTLRRAFARTHHVLANDYKVRAAGFWAKNKATETGDALVKAAGYLGHAAKWSGEKIEDAAVATGKGAKKASVESVRGVRWLGGKMLRGIAFVPEKVGEGLAWLGEGIDKVGRKVEPESKK